MLNWKTVRIISHNEAAKLTSGNTDKFMNKDYWLIGDKAWEMKTEGDIPVGEQAVYYHDMSWRLMEKVRS